MSYQIQGYFDARLKKTEISSDRFLALLEAKEVLLYHFASEQRYDISISNYVELEVVALTCAVRYTVWPLKAFRPDDDTISVLDRAIMNLLSSVRGYVDEAKRYRDKAKRRYIESMFSDASLRSLPYRAMEALRNYSQHYSLPTHTLAYENKSVVVDGEPKLIHRIVPRAALAGLERDRKVDVKLISDLKTLEENGTIAILPLVRGYVEEISRIHFALRDLCALNQQEARQS